MADPRKWFKGYMVFSGLNQGWTESFFMAGEHQDKAVKEMRSLARYRAALLGRDIELRYAAVATIGSDKPAFAAISHPIAGSTGVNLNVTDWTDADIGCDIPDRTIRYRFETATGKNKILQLRGMPDGVVAHKKYALTDDGSDIGPDPATGPFLSSETLTLPTILWDRTDEPDGSSTPAASLYPTFGIALQGYLGRLRDFTIYAKVTKDTSISANSETAPVVGNFVSDPATLPVDGTVDIAGFGTIKWNKWANVYYRGVSRVQTGRPSSR